MDTHEVLSLCCQSALTSNHNHKYQIKMKKTETLYSYLYKKSNKMWAVKYKFHKKDAYKNTSLGTRNKREAERKKRRFDLNLIKMGEDIADNNLDDELAELAGDLLKRITNRDLTTKWLVEFARKAHHIQSGGGSNTKYYTLSEWIDVYLEGLRRDVKPQSLENYVSDALPLKGLRCTRNGRKLGQASTLEVKNSKVEKISKKPLHLLETSDIREIREHLAKGKVRANTINKSLAILKRVLKQAHKDELTHRDLSLNVDFLKKTDSYKRGGYTEEEVEKLLKTAKGDWKGVIMVAIYTGLRATDCHELKWEMVDIENQTITLVPTKRRLNYDKGTLTLPIVGRLLTHLKSLAMTAGENRSGYIFNTPQYASETLSRAFKELREEAGVDYEVVVDGIKQKRDFHSLRHFHNTAMSKAGATAEERMSQLGHSRIETNQLYTHHDVEGRRKVLEKVFGT